MSTLRTHEPQLRLHRTVFSTMMPRLGMANSATCRSASARGARRRSAQPRQVSIGKRPSARRRRNQVARGPAKTASSVSRERSPITLRAS